MTNKFNSNKAKLNSQPYDSKINEPCDKCGSEIVYRKSSFFSKKIYYKVCNSCGWYQVIPKADWIDIVFGTPEKKAPAPQSTEPQNEQEAVVEGQNNSKK